MFFSSLKKIRFRTRWLLSLTGSAKFRIPIRFVRKSIRFEFLSRFLSLLFVVPSSSSIQSLDLLIEINHQNKSSNKGRLNSLLWFCFAFCLFSSIIDFVSKNSNLFWILSNLLLNFSIIYLFFFFLVRFQMSIWYYSPSSLNHILQTW